MQGCRLDLAALLILVTADRARPGEGWQSRVEAAVLLAAGQRVGEEVLLKRRLAAAAHELCQGPGAALLVGLVLDEAVGQGQRLAVAAPQVMFKRELTISFFWLDHMAIIAQNTIANVR